jgi:DNA invertase Pin-like site-specific DNA recombinase
MRVSGRPQINPRIREWHPEFQASCRLTIFCRSLNRDGASTGHPVEQISRGSRIAKICRDKCTGATASRPGLDELLSDCRRRSIDVVIVWKFDRFARSLKNLIAGLELCRALGIDFVSVTEAVDTSLPAGEMLFQMIGAVAQFERSLITERVRSGLANARANGKILGRPPLRKLTRKELADLRKQHVHEKLPFRALAEKFGLSVWTAHRLLKKDQLVGT